MIRTKEELKSYFETGDVPTEENFSDLIDTLVTETDLEEVEGKLDKCVDLTSEQKITAKKTFSGGISMNNTKILDVTAPTANGDAANKQYVDDTVKDNIATQVTYAELKSLRDAGKLVPGTQYRITDYTCTTTQAATKSAGHVFDIIVTADDESTLNEVARAVKHEGDIYFANSDLNAWKIWYCLDNDTTRFAWADETNGKGVIYRMIDEFNNDVPYDFKNIQFYRKWNAGKSLWSSISSDSTGVPCYTFSSKGNSVTTVFTDMSLLAADGIYSNVIKKSVSTNKQTLNNNCFFGDNCYSNTFGGNCKQNTFGNYCYWNTFGNNCNNNTFGNGFQYNTFGNGCDSNTFGNNCKQNTFGNGCDSNIFGNNCNNNIFGNECMYIKFALAATKYNYYRYNRFGYGCQYIVFTGAKTASNSQQVQNYNFAQGLQGTNSAYLTIDGVRNLSYETKVAKNSAGELKIYCEADFIL